MTGEPAGGAVVHDLHAHALPEALGELRADHAELVPRVVETEHGLMVHLPGRAPSGPVPHSMVNPRRRLAEMAAMGVDRQVVAVPPTLMFPDVEARAAVAAAPAGNDGLLALADDHPDRLHVFACLPLPDPDAAVWEVRRLAAHPRVRGVQVPTAVRGAGLDAAELDRVWAALAEADLPVWIHPDQRSVAGGERLGRHHLTNLVGNPVESTLAVAALVFGGVLERHPDLRVGVVHGGGFVPYQLGRWDHGWRVRPEAARARSTPPTAVLPRLWFDTLVHDPGALAFLGSRVGWQQVVLGSDHPFDMGTDDPVGALDAVDLAPADRAAVLDGNAIRFLRTCSA